MSYRPLPKQVTIKRSKVEGLGLFSTMPIEKDTELGITHYRTEKQTDNGVIRTPLGGFINHSDYPNCVLEIRGDEYYLITKKLIITGEELTLKYQMYNINDS